MSFLVGEALGLLGKEARTIFKIPEEDLHIRLTALTKN